MELELLDIIQNEIRENRKVCYAFIINQEGSSPRGVGTSMIIKQDGSIFGTIGGGSVEYSTMIEAKNCIEKKISKTISFDIEIKDKDKIKKVGSVEVFIKTYLPQKRLILAGAGHVAHSLYKFALISGFSVVVFDNRDEILTKDKYPNAIELIIGDVADHLKNYKLDENDYLVIASGSTKEDEAILKVVIQEKLAYIGMLGSKKKIESIRKNLINQNISEDQLNKVYAPIGLDLNGETPEEVALSIISEIVLVKNKGQLKHKSL